MPEFFNVLPPDQAITLLFENLQPEIGSEIVATESSLGRILCADITSSENLPLFARSSMDGFAVKADDTFGTSGSLPAYLTVKAEVPVGKTTKSIVQPGTSIKVHTGSALPNGANAVVIMENTQSVDENTIEVLKPVAPGENVIPEGEEIKAKTTVFHKGAIVRAQDIGGLMALGITEIAVTRKVRIALISTGDEVIHPTRTPLPGQVRDINSYTLAALIQKYPAFTVKSHLVGDNLNQLKKAAQESLELADMLIISAGSSVSSRDLTSTIVNELGTPGVITHGLAIKPGKPSILGVVGNKPVFGLPGNPVSAINVFDLIVRPTIYYMGGCDLSPYPNTQKAVLLKNIPSAPGREDYVQVKLISDNGKLFAEPVFGESNLIYLLVRSDGTVGVPLDKNGLYAGEEVTVYIND